MTREPILLIGPGGHAIACIDVIEQEGRFAIAGLVGKAQEIGAKVLGYPVVGTDDDLPRLVAQVSNVLITVGQIKTPEPRIRLFDLLQAINCQMPVIVSPFAYVSPHASLGAGTIVMHGAVVNAGAAIGRNCIINSQALVEHGVNIADHCHIATSTAINSGVQIGTGTFVGSNTCVRQELTIGDNCLIGMGQRVLTDCANGTCLPPAGARA